MGNKAQRGKSRPRSSGRTETAPSLRRPGRCRDCGAAVQGVGPTPAGRLRPAPPSPPHRPSSRGGQRRPRPRAPARPSADAAEHPPEGREGAAAPRCGPGAADRASPGQAPTQPPARSPVSAPIPEPAVLAVSRSAPR